MRRKKGVQRGRREGEGQERKGEEKAKQDREETFSLFSFLVRKKREK